MHKRKADAYGYPLFCLYKQNNIIEYSPLIAGRAPESAYASRGRVFRFKSSPNRCAFGFRAFSLHLSREANADSGPLTHSVQPCPHFHCIWYSIPQGLHILKIDMTEINSQWSSYK